MIHEFLITANKEPINLFVLLWFQSDVSSMLCTVQVTGLKKRLSTHNYIILNQCTELLN